MSTLDLEQPPAAPEPVGQHRLVHLVCCSPRRGLCGDNVADLSYAPDATPVSCTPCDAADEAGDTCGAIFCRFRQWLRQHLGSAQ